MNLQDSVIEYTDISVYEARSSCLIILLHYWTLNIVESEIHKQKTNTNP